MISFEQFREIRFCLDNLEMHISHTARQLGLHRDTVSIWKDRRNYIARKPVKRASKLDPFKPNITALLGQCPDYSGAQILGFLRRDGYGGGKSVLNGYLRGIRPPARRAFLTLHFPAGEMAQVDWGHAGRVQIEGAWRNVSFFVMVLCHSRMMYVEFTLSMAQEAFLSCHRHAFEYFGGVPQKVMVDNCKTAVLEHRGKDVKLNPHFVDFAQYYDFEIRACNVRQPQEKGRVENGVGYVKKNFLNGRSLEPFAALNPDVLDWLKNIANARTHGTTGKVPGQEFESEKELLKSPPLLPYNCQVAHPDTVNRLFRIKHDTNTYSVPHQYVGDQVTVRVGVEKIFVYKDQILLAQHRRSYGKRGDFELMDHPKALLQQRRSAEKGRLLRQFLQLGTEAETLYHELEKRKLDPLSHIRRILALHEQYGPDRLRQAIADALEFQAYGSEYIRSILEMRARPLPTPGPLHISHKTDLLDLQIDDPDLNIYNQKEYPHE
jgi:transposase